MVDFQNVFLWHLPAELGESISLSYSVLEKWNIKFSTVLSQIHGDQKMIQDKKIEKDRCISELKGHVVSCLSSFKDYESARY